MRESEAKIATRGLQDVIATETGIGLVDGVNGKLYYAGYDIDDLARGTCFEEIAHLLWTGELPDEGQLESLRKEIVSEMHLPEAVVQWLKQTPPRAHPMSVLRSAVSMLALYDPDGEDQSLAAARRKALRLTAKLPVIIATLHRFRSGLDLIPVDESKCLSENFLRLFLGREIDEEERQAIELMFILHAEHGLNASTFAARVTASTLADLYAAVTSALGTLQGPLHGGANQRVMQMLTEIGDPADVDDYIEGLLAAGKRVMGFGHRVYRVEDPRAKHLREKAAKVCYRDRACHYFHMSEVVEEKVREAKGIVPNVDFYSATVQQSLEIPVDYFTTLFAASRVAGWSAHVLEQLADNRLMRPRSQFTGRYPREFVPRAHRSREKA